MPQPGNAGLGTGSVLADQATQDHGLVVPGNEWVLAWRTVKVGVPVTPEVVVLDVAHFLGDLQGHQPLGVDLGLHRLR